VVCDHHRGQHPSEPLNSHEERNLVMRHEPRSLLSKGLSGRWWWS
jgi:hypothetical protein